MTPCTRAARAGRWPLLERLELDSLGEAGAEALALHGEWPALSSLSLGGRLGVAGWAALRDSGAARWPRLAELCITALGVGVAAGEPLIRGWPLLRALSVTLPPRGTDAGTKARLQGAFFASALPLLEELTLSSDFSAAAVTAALACAPWPRLRRLVLAEDQYNDRYVPIPPGFRLLLVTADWPELEELPLSRASGLLVLPAPGRAWPRLKYVARLNPTGCVLRSTP